MTKFASSPTVDGVAAIFTSSETKAIEAAHILGRVRGIPVTTVDDLQEIDRSATGFLPPSEFERTADAFFAEPESSVRGWERAVDAQARIVRVFETLLKTSSDGDVAIITHGGVGTLLLCRYLRMPISRKFDQPSQGHYWTLDIASRNPRHGWRPLA